MHTDQHGEELPHLIEVIDPGNSLEFGQWRVSIPLVDLIRLQDAGGGAFDADMSERVCGSTTDLRDITCTWRESSADEDGNVIVLVQGDSDLFRGDEDFEDEDEDCDEPSADEDDEVSGLGF